MIIVSEARINPVKDFFLAPPLEVCTEAVPALETGLFQGAFSKMGSIEKADSERVGLLEEETPMCFYLL